jgi:hypothetical protein
MKPLQIGMLVIAGALVGAVVMKVAERPRAAPSKPASAAAQPAAPTPVEPAPTPVEPAPVTAAVPQQAATPAENHRPTPFQAPKKQKPAQKARAVPPPANPRPEPVVVAKTDSPAAVTAPPVPAEMPRETTAPQPIGPARPEPENVTPPPPPEPHRVTLNAGILIPVRLVDGLSTERNTPGDVFVATLDHQLVVDGFVIAERGARVEGRVVAADRGGKVRGVAALAVELTRIRTSDGQNLAIQTDSFERHAAQTHGEDAAKIGVGAAIGAAIGAIAGGGKGAAIGAGAGGAAGAGDVLLTRGREATLPSETRINFRLSAPVTLTEKIRG